MRILKSILPVLLLIFANITWAHTGLKSSSPADGADLSASPQELRLEYFGAVALVRLQLAKANGEAVDLGFKPSAATAKSFSFTLPNLPAGSYTVEWSIIGADTHKIDGKFSFKVQAQ